MVQVGVIAIDGTKVHASASHHANRDYEQIVRDILSEADSVDRHEDEVHGDKRGDELPPHLSSSQGRNAWLRDARRRLDDQRAQEAKPIPQSRPARLKQAKRRLDEQLEVKCAANTAYEAYRARGVMKNGRRLGAPPKPYQPPPTPAGKVNVTDPDSRNVKTPRGYMAQCSGSCQEPQGSVLDDEQLLGVIKTTHEANYCAYGYRKMWLALKRAGHDVGRDRICCPPCLASIRTTICR